ncbi:MAG: hypothetical protein ACOY7U_01910 [Acidobacteriota bacterium]
MKARPSAVAESLKKQKQAGEDAIAELLRIWEAAKVLGFDEDRLREVRRQRQLGRRRSPCLEALDG